MDSGCIHDAVYIVSYIFSFLRVADMSAELCQMLRKVAFGPVRSAYREMPLQEHFGQSAHADPADAYEVYVHRFLKIYFVHVNLTFLIKILSLEYINLRKNTMLLVLLERPEAIASIFNA